MKALRAMPDVSRETKQRLQTYEELLRKWNPKINLVSKSTLNEISTRHIKDSSQIFELAPDGVSSWVDLGSGGGFPGLVVAILAAEFRPDVNVTLVESDQRKCTFLRTVARETGVKVKVIAERIEKIEPLGADVLSARALADLGQLLAFADRHLKPTGTALFPKGITWEKEVDEARRGWSFEMEPYTSETEANSVILKIKDIKNE